MNDTVRHTVRKAVRQYLYEPGREPIRRQNRSWLTGPEAVAFVRRTRQVERTLSRRSCRLALGAAR